MYCVGLDKIGVEGDDLSVGKKQNLHPRISKL